MWLLIVLLSSGGYVSGTSMPPVAEFRDKAACEAAADWIVSVDRRSVAKCFPKETVIKPQWEAH